MLTDQQDPYLEKDAQEIDEGWWASVLSDEQSIHPKDDDEMLIKETDTTTTEPHTVNWDKVQEVYDLDEIIPLEVYAYNRGGLLVHGDGIQGFVPISHLIDLAGVCEENERQTRLANYVGCSLRLKVIECEPSLERVVLSERAALAGEGQRKQLFKSLCKGSVVTGTVTNVTDFGIFVDLGGVEGLIHVSELSWGRVRHPSDVLQVDQEVETLVLQVSEESVRVALSLKRLFPNPWDEIVENHRAGDIVDATVTAIMRFGVFAKLEEGVEGLIHISSMKLPPGQKDLSKLFQPGDYVRVRILHIDANRRRLGLGLVSSE